MLSKLTLSVVTAGINFLTNNLATEALPSGKYKDSLSSDFCKIYLKILAALPMDWRPGAPREIASMIFTCFPSTPNKSLIIE